jgi:PPE family
MFTIKRTMFHVVICLELYMVAQSKSFAHGLTYSFSAPHSQATLLLSPLIPTATAHSSYVQFLSAAAHQAEHAGGQARAIASSFEAEHTATIHPAIVTANRTQLVQLVRSNFLGLNTPAISALEYEYFVHHPIAP